MTPRRLKLSRVLDDLRQSERQLRATIVEVERLLAAEPDLRIDDDPAAGDAHARGLREEAVAYASGGEERGEFYGWELSPAVLELLRRANDALSNRALIASLESAGFRFRSKKHDVAVAQCLHRLMGEGRVIRLSRGSWKHADRADRTS